MIFVEGGDSFLLRRRPYDKTFKREEYSPDPSEGRATSLRGRLEDFKEDVEQRMDTAGEAWQERIGLKFDELEKRWAQRKRDKARAKKDIIEP